MRQWIVDLPEDLRREIFVRYRTELRRGMALRRLHHTRTRRLIAELHSVYEFANGNADIVLQMLARALP